MALKRSKPLRHSVHKETVVFKKSTMYGRPVIMPASINAITPHLTVITYITQHHTRSHHHHRWHHWMTSHHISPSSWHHSMATHHISPSSWHHSMTSHHISPSSWHHTMTSHHISPSSWHHSMATHHISPSSWHHSMTSHHISPSSWHHSMTSHHISPSSWHHSMTSHHISPSSWHHSMTSHHISPSSSLTLLMDSSSWARKDGNGNWRFQPCSSLDAFLKILTMSKAQNVNSSFATFLAQLDLSIPDSFRTIIYKVDITSHLTINIPDITQQHHITWHHQHSWYHSTTSYHMSRISVLNNNLGQLLGGKPYLLKFSKQVQSMHLRSFSNYILKHKLSITLLFFCSFVLHFFSFLFPFCLVCPILLL